MRYRSWAIVLLIANLLHSYAWQMVPAELSGHVWSASGSLLRLLLLLLVIVGFHSVAMTSVCLLMIAGELIVTGCTALYLLRPWPAIPGESCTARLNLPLGVIGAVLGLAILISLVRRR